ncbi:hypothetical protein CMT37_09090 [Elizabethkingia anophelis]|nr:hypothetical protein [Elizabethkingia anophelis]
MEEQKIHKEMSELKAKLIAENEVKNTIDPIIILKRMENELNTLKQEQTTEGLDYFRNKLMELEKL